MSRQLFLFISGFIFIAVFTSWKVQFAGVSEPQPRTVIGVEYTFPGMAKALATTGIAGVKYFPDIYEWGDMQKKAGGAISFYETDRYVKEYEEAGFTSLVMALRSNCDWGCKSKLKDLSPKPEYADQYKKWIAAVVERYDGDGQNDMPGLKIPVIYFEIGTEFSSYEPESADDYIEMLTLAYKAAHEANPDVKILHAAFLTTTAITSKSTVASYNNDFGLANRRIMYHPLADIRKILDRPDIFDVVNFHSLGDPYEIEAITTWLKWEMSRRGYSKQLFISDTTPTPFIAWGNATECDKKPDQLGVVVSPFEESDRCKLNGLFQKIIDEDTATMSWLYGFLATDLVKKCVIASDMHVIQINTAFSEDIGILKMKLFKAGAGTSAWAGILVTKADGKTNMLTVTGYRPVFYALKQVQNCLGHYSTITRVTDVDAHVRIYKLNGSTTNDLKDSYIAWYESDKIPLPGEQVISKKVKIKVDFDSMWEEKTVQRMNQTTGERRQCTYTQTGEIEVELTNVPVFLH